MSKIFNFKERLIYYKIRVFMDTNLEMYSTPQKTKGRNLQMKIKYLILYST